MLGLKLRNPVLIIGGNLTGLQIAREFGKRHVDIYLLTEKENDVALGSKYLKNRIIVPRPWDCKFLKKLVKGVGKTTTKKLVVYPATDIDALNLSKVKEELRDDYYLVVGEREATETLVNKNKFYQALRKTSIEFPETFFPEDLASAKSIGKNLNYPVFIRPSITQSFTKVFGISKGFIAKSYNLLLNYYQLAASKNIEVMFQEIISGPPSNSFQIEGYFDKEFCSTGFFARQRLRIWPQDFGNTTLCVSIPLCRLSFESKQIADFIKKNGYNGLASAELKKDPRDGKNKLLEINARAWLHFWLSAECGNNILLSSYLDSIGEKIEYKQDYTAGIKSIHLDNNFLATSMLIKKGELGFLEWFSDLKEINRSGIFDKTDLFPFFAKYSKRFFTFFVNRASSLFFVRRRKDIKIKCPKCEKELPLNSFAFCPRCSSTVS